MTTEINRADLEAKLREIEGVVLEVEEETRSRRRLIVAGAVVVVVGVVAFGMWRRRNNRIRVEVYHL